MEQDDKLIQSFKTLNILYMALGAGMLMSSAVFVFLVGSGQAGINPDMAGVFKFIVPVMGLGSYLGGKFLYDKQAQKSKGEQDQTKKFGNYQTACLIVWAMLEGSALFSSISYLLTGDKLFLAFFSLILLAFLFSKPNINKFQQDF